MSRISTMLSAPSASICALISVPSAVSKSIVHSLARSANAISRFISRQFITVLQPLVRSATDYSPAAPGRFYPARETNDQASIPRGSSDIHPPLSTAPRPDRYPGEAAAPYPDRANPLHPGEGDRTCGCPGQAARGLKRRSKGWRKHIRHAKACRDTK